jgi:hypothetical protein
MTRMRLHTWLDRGNSVGIAGGAVPREPPTGSPGRSQKISPREPATAPLIFRRAAGWRGAARV